MVFSVACPLQPKGTGCTAPGRCPCPNGNLREDAARAHQQCHVCLFVCLERALAHATMLTEKMVISDADTNHTRIINFRI